MRSLFYSITIFTSTIGYGWNVLPDTLHEKCNAPAPSWILQQIEKDLHPFAEQGVNSTMVDSTLEAIFNAKEGSISELVKIHIQDGKAIWMTPFTLSKHAKNRLTTFISALNLLLEIIPLPDVEFLLSLANHYDRPLFSLFTKAPVFTVCKEKSFAQAVLFPNILWTSDFEKSIIMTLEYATTIPWKERTPSAFWRGSSSELYTNFYWDFNGRSRLIFLSRAHPDLIDAAFIDNEYIQAMAYHWQHFARDNELIKSYTPIQNQLKYRYLIAIDGDATPASLPWQLFSGSTLLKSDSTRIEWFYEGLEPFVHYLPFNPYRSDLVEHIAWLHKHDDLAQKMARKAKKFAKNRLSDENAFLYTYKLLQAYSLLYTSNYPNL